jgi:hypothetical protein
VAGTVLVDLAGALSMAVVREAHIDSVFMPIASIQSWDRSSIDSEERMNWQPQAQ